MIINIIIKRVKMIVNGTASYIFYNQQPYIEQTLGHE